MKEGKAFNSRTHLAQTSKSIRYRTNTSWWLSAGREENNIESVLKEGEDKESERPKENLVHGNALRMIALTRAG